jgi:hypothetical protein
VGSEINVVLGVDALRDHDFCLGITGCASEIARAIAQYRVLTGLTTSHRRGDAFMKTASVIALALIATPALVAQSTMRPGLWEITTQMQMPNLPVQMPETKMTQCVTPAQAKDPASTVPRGPQSGRGASKDDCKVADLKTSGNKTTWSIACTSPNKVTGTGEMTFSDDSYTGTTKMSMAQGEMTMKVSGKRVGDCKP